MATLNCIYPLQGMDSSPLTAKDCFADLKKSTQYEIVLSAVIEKIWHTTTFPPACSPLLSGPFMPKQPN